MESRRWWSGPLLQRWKMSGSDAPLWMFPFTDVENWNAAVRNIDFVAQWSVGTEYDAFANDYNRGLVVAI